MTKTKTFSFDGTAYTLDAEKCIITEGDVTIDLWFDSLTLGLTADARTRAEDFKAAGRLDAWGVDRIAYVANLAARRMVNEYHAAAARIIAR